MPEPSHPDSPLRLLMVITDLNVGGVPLYLARLANWLADRNVQVHVVSLAPLGLVAGRFDPARIAVSTCDARGPFDLPALLRLRWLIRTHRPDLIQSFLFHANLAVRLVGPSAGVPSKRILCEIQTVEIERRWHLTLDRWTINRCALEIGNSASVVEHLSAAGLPRRKLRLIPGGIDSAPFENARPLDRSTLGIRDRDPILLWTGRLDPVKNLDQLIEAFALLLKHRPAHLLLAGDGPLRPALEARIRQRRLADRVRLLGVRDDVPRLLKTADVFVFPSRTEGLPNAVLEALAAGCPVVASDVPGSRDIIAHERNGLLVQPENVPELCKEILNVLNNKELAEARARAGARTVRDRFRQTDNFVGHLNLYRELNGGTPRDSSRKQPDPQSCPTRQPSDAGQTGKKWGRCP